MPSCQTGIFPLWNGEIPASFSFCRSVCLSVQKGSVGRSLQHAEALKIALVVQDGGVCRGECGGALMILQRRVQLSEQRIAVDESEQRIERALVGHVEVALRGAVGAGERLSVPPDSLAKFPVLLECPADGVTYTAARQSECEAANEGVERLFFVALGGIAAC